MNAGLIGGLIGCLIGLAGGIYGSYCSVKNTSGPRERAFMIKSVALFWFAALIFLALLFLLPHPWRWFTWVAWPIILPLFIVLGNKKQRKIRAEEQNASERDNSR